jgi:hypothetical protein
VSFATPAAIPAAAAPFDVFIFRSGDLSHQVHFPTYQGTAVMNASLFNSGQDRSSASRRFVHASGVPAALNLMTTTRYPLEGTAVSELFPAIVGFATSGGASGADFYLSGVVTSQGHDVPARALPVAPSTDTSCVLAPGPRVTGGLRLDLDAGIADSYPGSGTPWRDLSGHGLDATLGGQPGFTAAGGGGLTFNGTSQFVEGGVLEPTRMTLTVGFEATGPSNVDDSYGGVLLVNSPQLHNNAVQYALSYSWASQRLTYAVQANGPIVATADGAVLRNRRYQATVTYDGSMRRLYVNGILTASSAWTLDPVYPRSGNRNLQIGRWGYQGWPRNFRGVIHQVRVYDRALDAAEVQQNFEADRVRFGY